MDYRPTGPASAAFFLFRGSSFETVPHSRVALYLDVEGIPDRDFDYLIGLVAVVGDCTTTYFFWADDQSQEKAIWDACSKIINGFEDYTLYHYGQYELRFLDRMRGLADEEGVATIDRIRARSCNVLAAIYSHIYFPTPYNGLKDVATFLGASWTAANASGIQSMAWRLAWETSRDETLKQQLFRYNEEDCLALRRVRSSCCLSVLERTQAVAPRWRLPRTSRRRRDSGLGRTSSSAPSWKRSTVVPTPTISGTRFTYGLPRR